MAPARKTTPATPTPGAPEQYTPTAEEQAAADAAKAEAEAEAAKAKAKADEDAQQAQGDTNTPPPEDAKAKAAIAAQEAADALAAQAPPKVLDISGFRVHEAAPHSLYQELDVISGTYGPLTDEAPRYGTTVVIGGGVVTPGILDDLKRLANRG